MLGVNKEEKKYSVSVIVNDSNNDRWIAMREGLEQAAKDDDIQLNYVSTGVFASEDEEKALIEREVEKMELSYSLSQVRTPMQFLRK